MLLFVGEHVGAPREPEHVEDQADAPVAQDRCAGERVDALQVRAERLDHDLGGVADRIDDQPEAPVVGLEHDDRAGADLGRLAAELA